MLNFIFKQWKNRRLSVILIISGYCIGMLVMSIGISVTQERVNYIYDSYSGNPEQYSLVNLKINKNLSLNRLNSAINKLSHYGETQIINTANLEVKNKEKVQSVQPITVLIDNKSNWHIPIISGRYFDKEDMSNNTQEIILGTRIAKDLNAVVGDKVLISNQEFIVIGICGRNYRETQWDYVIYTPYYDLLNVTVPKVITLSSSNSENETITYRMTIRNNIQYIKQQLNNNNLADDIEITFENTSEKMDKSVVKNSIIITSIATVLILTITILNVINLTVFWMLERKKELSIMMCLGATNKFIFKWVVIEVLMMSCIGCIIALGLQKIIWNLFKIKFLTFDIYLEISILNVILVLLMATICGLIAALIPAYRTIRISPTEVMNTNI